MGRRNIGVAIGLPEPFTSQLQASRQRLGDPNAASIPPHITLLPPTGLRPETLPEVEVHLQAVAAAAAPFVVHLRGSGTFRPLSPVVFVPLAEGTAQCERLEASVRSGPLRRELRFPYHPHVTVAHEVAEPLLDQAFDELASYTARFEVWGFSLFEQGGDGVWRPQRDFPLGDTLPGPVQDPAVSGKDDE